MKKKLFENVNGNQFRLVESDWRTTQEHNNRLNQRRRMLRHIVEYVTVAASSPHASPEIKTEARQVIKDCKAFDKVLNKAYLSSGYQYDDDDVRNQMDVHGDRYFDANIAKQRTGSNKEEEIEAELRAETANRHIDEYVKKAIEFFNDARAKEIWPVRDRKAETLFGRLVGHGTEWTPPCLAEFLEEIASEEHEAARDREESGD